MACEQSRQQFFGAAGISGSAAAVAAFGSAAQAAAALGQIYQTACARQDYAVVEAQAATRLLFAEMRLLGLNPLPHRSTAGLPRARAQQGYTAVLRTLLALRAGIPLPPLAARVQQRVFPGRRIALDLPASILACFAEFQHAGGTTLLVGGGVRDALAGSSMNDVDVKVFGLTRDQLIAIVRRHGNVMLPKQSAGEVRVRLADGHDLDVVAVPDLLPQAALEAGCDFTINAMAVTQDGRVLDWFGGQADLQAGLLRHVGPAFITDPIRVLRGMQFAARKQLHLHPDTAVLCRSLAHLHRAEPTIRIWREWEKLLLHGTRPSAGLRLLKESGWLENYPELAALDGVPQEADHHPEGDAFVHTLHVTDKAAEIADRDGLTGDDRAVLVLAGMGHDQAKSIVTVGTAAIEAQTVATRQRLLGVAAREEAARLGVPQHLLDHMGETEEQSRAAVLQLSRAAAIRHRKTTYGEREAEATAAVDALITTGQEFRSGQISSATHEAAGVLLNEVWLRRIGCPERIRAHVVQLTQHHMRWVGVHEADARVVRRLAADLQPVSLAQWARICEADVSGRPPLPPAQPCAHWLDVAAREGVQDTYRVPPLLTGRDLIQRGLKPGPAFKPILAAAEAAQIDGVFADHEAAQHWLTQYLHGQTEEP